MPWSPNDAAPSSSVWCSTHQSTMAWTRSTSACIAVFVCSRTAVSTVVLSSLPGWFAMSLLDQGPPTVGPLSAALVSSGETLTETSFETFLARVRLLLGLRGLDAASQSSAGSTTEQSPLEHRSAGCWSSPGSVSEPVSRPPWGLLVGLRGLDAASLRSAGSTTEQSPLEHRSAGCWSSPGCVSEPVSRPPWGCLSACAVSTRPRCARPARPPNRARSSIGPLVVGRARGASASRRRDRPGAACRLAWSRRGLAELGRLDHHTTGFSSITEQGGGATTERRIARGATSGGGRG